jgi:HTH-type transcriptional regulator / antitoxin HigA
MGKTSSPEAPGDAIKRLMTQRGWSQIELSYVLGVTAGTISQIVNSKRPITAEMAKLLGVAFNKNPEYFAEMQARWDLQNAPDPSDEVRIRASGQSDYPVRAMIKRGWIDDPGRGNGTYGALCRFFGMNSLDGIADIGFAARRTDSAETTGSQLAWLYRVRAIAREMPTPAYSRNKLESAIERMSLLRSAPEEARHVAGLLNDAGVRFVVVEGLPGGHIDGVCTWLDEKSPTIGMSLRFDRIDNFWFVLRHECAHVLHTHGGGKSIIDADLSPMEGEINNEEEIADAEATDFCVPTEKMRSFFLRKNPFFSDVDVRAFAKINNVHPGLVVGQLQHMTKKFQLLRAHLVAIRKFVISSAMVDGWGNAVSVN